MSEYFKSFSIVYKREYIDSEDQHDDPNFFIGYVLFIKMFLLRN